MPLVKSLAANVERETAAIVAQNFFYEKQLQSGVNSNIFELTPLWKETRMSNGQPVFHIFNFEQGGFVIISAEDCYIPVLGYSISGNFPAGQLEPNYSSFLKSYEEQIDFIRENGIQQTAEIKESWGTYESINTPRMSFLGDRDIAPLMSILWNQDYPYNAYCPESAGGPGGRVYAGCVATAMSMIMAHYRYPEQGTGSHSYYYGSYGNISANFGQTYYDWDAMLNSISTGSGRAINAIAELQFHCGVSVDMMYAPDGSGAYSEDVPYAMRTYFGYSPIIQHLRKNNYSAAVWENFVVASLEAKQPLYYSGQSSEGGHAFVLDGFETSGTGKMFHFNFGWSGSGNGYYTLADVNGFSSYQGMVRNFIPHPDNYPLGCNNHVITSPLGIFEDRSGPINDYQPNKSCSWLIAPEDSVTSITIKFNLFDIGLGDVVNIYDGENVSSPLLASYTQGSSPETLNSSGDRLYVEFLTDAVGEAPGFIAEFISAFPEYCSGTVTMNDPVGSFSDGSGDNRYNNNSMCKWRIEPGTYTSNLTLAFSSFDLEEGQDFLKVYALPANQLLANLTGTEIPAPIVAPTGRLLLLFTSNGFNNRNGFNAEYFIDNVGVTNPEFSENLSVYPNPAKGFTEVAFVNKEASTTLFAITDLSGRVVYQSEFFLNSGINNTILRFGDLKAGIYILNIRNKNGSVSRKLALE